MKMNENRIHAFLSGFFLILAAAACDQTYAPRPPGYFRIDLPEKNFIQLDSTFPYTFEYPSIARIAPDRLAPDEPNWINIEYPQFKGSIHISYKAVNNNLQELLEDARTLALKHIPKATAIREELVIDPQQNVYGLVYDIRGSAAASPYQFFLTDSSSHFLRGALYFRVKPNNDSLAPVIDYIVSDIDHLIGTFRWK
jgi:gliding motility-associated lipoprotein GldD